jgi:hypothetical protein
MSKGELTPAQVRFLAAYIDKDVLGQQPPKQDLTKQAFPEDQTRGAAIINLTQLDGALRAALSLAANQARQMSAWDLPGAKATSADFEGFEKRAAALFAQTMFDSKTAAATAKAARADLQADLDRVNAAAAKVLEDIKQSAAQDLREIELRFAVALQAFRDIDDVTFAKGQKAAAEGVLAQTRTAIIDVMGQDPQALAALRNQVDRAEAIVRGAQNATQTNARIKANLEDIRSALDRGSRQNPHLAQECGVIRAALAGLSRTWESMVLAQAVQAVSLLRARVAAQFDVAKQRGTRSA